VGPVDLTLAIGRYDRSEPLADGRATVEGCATRVVFLDPEECFWRMLRHAEFDAAEMSLGSYCMLRARGDDRFVGVPAFPSRSFRHSSIYVRDDGSVTEPTDLAGRAFGVPEYQMTAAVWVRGLLAHDLGVDLSDVVWRTGGIEEPGREERQPLQLPPEFRVEPIPADRTLVQELLDGGIDALHAPRVPAAFRPPGSGIRRLLPDYDRREREWYDRTRIFPIMHTVVLRRELVDAHPWLPVSLLKGLEQAKRVALAGVADAPALRFTMPFLLATLEDQAARFGDDPWPYGLAPNRPTLDAFLDLLREQGLLAGPLTPEDLFAPSTHRTARI
jgi:4,5-dihydroxyphthalate decarboxylase